MMGSLRRLCSLNFGLANGVLPKFNFTNVSVRSIYSERALGIIAYEKVRFTYQNQFLSIQKAFREKVQEICNKEDTKVYTEDLKAMLHLVQKDEKDLDLVIEMLKKYAKCQQESDVAEAYVFGPVLMRMLYYLNQPDRAMALFEDPDIRKIIKRSSSYTIFACLLYKNERYKDIRDVCSKCLSTGTNEDLMKIILIVQAACLKEGIPESFEYSLFLWDNYMRKSHSRLMRPNAIAAYIAIITGQNEKALQILDALSIQQFTVLKSVRMMAMANLGNFLHIVPLLKQSLEEYCVNSDAYNIPGDVVQHIVERLDEADATIKSNIMDLISKIRELGRIDAHETLENLLLKPIQWSHKDNAKRLVSNRRRQFDASM